MPRKSYRAQLEALGLDGAIIHLRKSWDADAPTPAACGVSVQSVDGDPLHVVTDNPAQVTCPDCKQTLGYVPPH